MNGKQCSWLDPLCDVIVCKEALKGSVQLVIVDRGKRVRTAG